jgi:hypothetical protein
MENGSRIRADIVYDPESRRDTVAYAQGTNVAYTRTPRGDLDGHDHSLTGDALGDDFDQNGVGQADSPCQAPLRQQRNRRCELWAGQ